MVFKVAHFDPWLILIPIAFHREHFPGLSIFRPLFIDIFTRLLTKSSKKLLIRFARLHRLGTRYRRFFEIHTL